MNASERVCLEQVIFNYLVKTGVAKEGKHYTVDPSGMGKVWNDSVYATVVQAVFSIDRILE